MSISSSTRKAGPFACNGATVAFPFAFKVFTTADVRVVLTDSNSVESDLALGTNYTVALNPDQDANPGGTVTTTAAYATGYKITLTSQVQNLQPLTLTNQGGFYPQVINNALDRLTIMAQQLAEQVSRAVKTSISSSSTPDQLLSDIGAAVTNASNSATAAAGSATASAGSATNSANSATASANSAAAAAQSATDAGNTPVAVPTHAAAGKATPVDADEIPLVDSAASWALKKLTWANLKATLGLIFWSLTAQPTMRNKIINGSFLVDQRNAFASHTVQSGNVTYQPDRFFVWAQGASCTGQIVTVNGANRYRFTGAASNTLVALGTRLESKDVGRFYGKNATLSVKAASSSLTSLTWTAYYANSTDNFGALNSPAQTQIATGTFNIGSAEATFSATFPVATTSGIAIHITGGALGAGQTLTLGDIQLEEGAAATAFEQRPFGAELLLCQRYFASVGNLGSSNGSLVEVAAGVFTISNTLRVIWQLPVQMRAVPTCLLAGTAGTDFTVFLVSQQSPGTYSVSVATPTSVSFDVAGGSISATQGQCGYLRLNTTTGRVTASAEL